MKAIEDLREILYDYGNDTALELLTEIEEYKNKLEHDLSWSERVLEVTKADLVNALNHVYYADGPNA